MQTYFKEKDMKRYLTFICFCISIGSLFGLLAQGRDLEQKTAILTFSSEGCQLAKNLGLKVSQNNNECIATVRFDAYRLGGGGSIRLDDDQMITISSTSLLAWRPAPDISLPDTAGQKDAMLRFLIFMLLALCFTTISMMLAFGESKTSSKKKSEP